jgi:hypothetical protein
MRLSGLAIVLALVAAKPAAASVAIPQTPESLTRQASAVIRGAVLSQEAGVDLAAHVRVIRTRVQVLERWTGSTPEVITVQQIGSLHGGAAQGVAGDARFKLGEEVVLFLAEGRDAEAGYWFLLGLGQGKYAIHRTEGRATVVERTTLGLTLTRQGAAATSDAALPIETLKQLVVGTKGGAR